VHIRMLRMSRKSWSFENRIFSWMDLFLLDTNAVSGLLKGNRPLLIARSAATPLQQQIIPSIVRAELLFGWQDSPNYATRIHELEIFLAGFPTASFDDEAAREYGKLRSYLKQAGMLIGPNDLIIASIALAGGYVLVTHNTAEFARVPGLSLEDWQM